MLRDSNSSEGLFPTIPGKPTVEMVFDPVQTDVSMNKFRLQLLLQQYQEDRDRPKYSEAWPWLAVAAAFLGALLPADFVDFLRIDAAVWEASFIMATVICTLGFIWRLCSAFQYRDKKAPEPEAAIEQIITEMRERQLQSIPPTRQESDIPDAQS